MSRNNNSFYPFLISATTENQTLHVYDSWEEPPVNCFFSCFKFTFVVQNFQLDMTCISSRSDVLFCTHVKFYFAEFRRIGSRGKEEYYTVENPEDE